MIRLSVLQDYIYPILVEFDRICRKYDIKYSLEGGTLMGAVKFQNFVPWDDDIDVIMVRDQYEKFLKVAPTELGSEFFLASYNNRTKFPYNFAKLYLDVTKVNDFPYAHIPKMRRRIFMDIFPVDNVVPEKLKYHCSMVGVLTGARRVKLKKKNKVKSASQLLYKILSFLPLKTLIDLVDKVCRRYNKKETGYIYEVSNPNRNFPPMPSSIYKEHIELQFRDKRFMAIKDYDNFLKSRFGENYANEMPTEDKRKASHNLDMEIVFDVEYNT
jgi:lipopolysaccharide cholinephosphotransferase